MNDLSADAISGVRPEPNPPRIDSADQIAAGDIVVVASMDADSPRRIVVALDSDAARRSFLGALVTNELSLATADDVVLRTAETGLPYSIVVMTQLAGHLWFSQACGRLGRLTDEALESVLAGHAWAENDFQRERRGIPLQDQSRDLRWSDLTDEMRQMEKLTEDCTLRRHESDWAGPDGEPGRYISEQTA